MTLTSWRLVLAIVLALALTTVSGDIARLVLLPQWLDGLAYAHNGLSYLIDIVGFILLVRLVGGASLKQQWAVSGLGQPWQPALVMGLLLFSPIFVAGIALGKPATDLTVESTLFLGVLAPFAEEVTFRGLAVGGLMALAGWRFWPAVLLPAVVFGLGHAAQGDDLTEMAGVVAITAVGSIFFSWLYLRFDRNLWPAVVMHIGMNTVWTAFDLGENAIGGALGNALRLAAVLGAIAFALWGREWLMRISGQAARN
jgi:membrane protease YdiL (CAAX protease family)